MAIQKLIGKTFFWRGLYFITALIVNIIISRYLKASLTGTVLYFANIFSFLALLVGLGFDSGFTYFASKALIPYSKLAFFSIFWVILAATLCIVTKSFFLSILLTDNIPSLPGFAWYAVAYISGLMLMNFFSALFYAKGNFSLPSILYTIINVLIIIAVWVAGRQGGISQKNIIDIYFYSTFLQGIVLIPAFLVIYRQPVTTPWLQARNIKQLLTFSIFSLGANIVFFLINRIDFFFVNKYCTPSDLGNYIQVARLGQLLLFFPQVIASVVFPQTSGNSDNLSIAKSTLSMGRLMGFLFMVIFLIILVAGSWIFPFIFGYSFSKMHTLFLIFLPGFFSLSYLALISAFLLGNGQIKVNLTGTMLAMGVVVAGDILVVKKWGVFAAAWVSTLAYFCNFVYSAFIFRKKYHFSISDMFKLNTNDLVHLKSFFLRRKNT